jgi:SAM-dependent methyltransferase
MPALYDTIGVGYFDLRQPDWRIERVIRDALGNAATVLNVGSGTGSYEPSDRSVFGVEPSMTMIRQRPVNTAPIIQASAMALPFQTAAFDATLAILTVHHWPHKDIGLRELRRVSRDRVVILTWDPVSPGFWLTDYFPEILDIDREIFPALDEIERELGRITVSTVPIPHDCSDGFLGAYWRRPESYLNAQVRSAISTFSKLHDVASGLARLRQDLASGEWHRRYGDILERSESDLGYRLVINV